MKAFPAIFLAATLLLTRAAQAMEIWRFDKLAGDDQITYVDRLAQSVEDATKGKQLARVKKFFMLKQPGENISGMGQFELNLSLARVADLRAIEKNSKARRLEVEDVMYVTLERNGIILPNGFKPHVINFQPKYPPSKTVMTKEEAGKALAQTRAWVAIEPSQGFRAHLQHSYHGPVLSDTEKGIALFMALAAIKMAVDNAAGPSGNTDSSGGSRNYYDDMPENVKAPYGRDMGGQPCLYIHTGCY